MKCQDFHKENDELYSFTQGGTIDNLKSENIGEKNNLEKLLLKLKEREVIYDELEKELYEVYETISAMNKKYKVRMSSYFKYRNMMIG